MADFNLRRAETVLGCIETKWTCGLLPAFSRVFTFCRQKLGRVERVERKGGMMKIWMMHLRSGWTRKAHRNFRRLKHEGHHRWLSRRCLCSMTKSLIHRANRSFCDQASLTNTFGQSNIPPRFDPARVCCNVWRSFHEDSASMFVQQLFGRCHSGMHMKGREQGVVEAILGYIRFGAGPLSLYLRYTASFLSVYSRNSPFSKGCAKPGRL